jgi:hypothetical protein
MSNLKYFKLDLIVTILGAIAAFFVGKYYIGTVAGGWQMLFLAMVLAVLEISLSFDNAVVNATVLKEMTPLWQKRFLTWGIFIAVFVMRLVFPLALVGIVAHVNPWDALVLAATKPEEYAAIMLSAHHSISAFGGAFLLMVCLKYFFDADKDVHWIGPIEKQLVKLGKMQAIELGMALTLICVFAKFVAPEEQLTFIVSGVWGLVTYIIVDGIGGVLKAPTNEKGVDLNKASIGMFLYLEVLDASFSFDGVVGAFAITNNLFIIMIGLGIGAMFVRSMTIMLVEKGTLTEFRFLEHGAFYAIGSLAVIMFTGVLFHIPEVITGLLGAGLIGISIFSSICYNKKHAA